MTKHDANRWLILLLIGYLAVTVTYSVVNPLFEAPDEHHHFAVAHFLAETGQLPVIDGAADAWLGQEAAQPPLYYGLASVLLRPIAVEYPVENVWINPFVQLGDAWVSHQPQLWYTHRPKCGRGRIGRSAFTCCASFQSRSASAPCFSSLVQATPCGPTNHTVPC